MLTGLKGRISVLLVEQYLDFAVRIADAVVVLSRGAVVERADRDSLDRDRLSRHIAV